MLSPDLSSITTDKIQLPLLNNKKISLDILRLDKIHPEISGNKWFKLKYHLEKFKNGNYQGILTFGGAWSNHLLATACICFLQKIKCVGIIRGEKPVNLSSTLKQSMAYGMNLRFISRNSYKEKSSEEFLLKINADYPGYYVIPEGGAGPEGEKGALDILDLVNKDLYSHIICAIGTSTMYNGIAKGVSPSQQVIGIPVLKGLKYENSSSPNKIFYQYHFGGYAKNSDELFSFMNDFYKQTSIPTDFVYTGKLFYAVLDLISQNYIPANSNLLAIHSGGLQGNDSLPKGTLIF